MAASNCHFADVADLPTPLNPANKLLDRLALQGLLGSSTVLREHANIEKYQRAMCHKSYCLSTYTTVAHANEYALLHKEGCIQLQDGESNERMEFLGDAVLGLIVAEYLYIRYPKESEGFMTQMRASLVNGEMLARLGRIIGIQRFVLLSKTMENSRHSKAVVEDTFEAFAAAMFMDLGLECTKRWFFELVESNLDFVQLISDSYKDMLIRYYRDNYNRSVQFPWLSLANGKDAAKKFYVKAVDPQNAFMLGEGYGATKREADNAASRQALMRYGFSL